MPSYVMHIAIAQEYLKRHKEDREQFINGTIFPDVTTDKSLTHYGKSPAYTSLKRFLENNKLDNSFIKGHFLHLITDYLFYNKYLDRLVKDILYNDYDILNKDLIEKYEVILPENVLDKIFYKTGNALILNMELACRVIDEISKLEIEIVEKEVKSDMQEWNIYKKLI